ncbi:BgTH12-06543 [Blumeria graminis f. sp. triticale]|uniref:BgtE-10137 n=3 Tax=Blumeria graminis TaxID=34373 RepID=A0A061HHA1_BLUGR|nr:putative secreted effector protein [Blumeria graminis f. sp. tritici 96224]CAD6500838.1 BgTH12-06543 [Blumeria graminis f. sp. triticale]VCU41130.1 BgtE-10137 [Blumeria graminis f. sp. tritici]
MKFLSVSGVAFILSLSGSVMPMAGNSDSQYLPVPDPAYSFSFTCGGQRTYTKDTLDRYVDKALGRMNSGGTVYTTQAFQFTRPGPYYITYIHPDRDVYRTQFNREEHVIFDREGFIMGGMTYEAVNSVPKYVACRFSSSTRFM